MANCSEESKKLGVAFSSKIKIGKASGKLDTGALVNTLSSSLKSNIFDPIAIAHIIQGVMKVTPLSVPKLVKLFDIEEIKSFIEANTNKDASKVEDNMSMLSEIEGFSDFDQIVTTLKKVAENNITSIVGEKDVFQVDKKLENSLGTVVDPDIVIIDTLTADNTGTEMLRRRSTRILRTKGLKESSADFWVPFLSTYFPGMSGVGAEFIDWTKDKFYSALIDNSSDRNGFIFDIHKSINDIKSTVQHNVLSSTVAYTEGELNSSVINGNDSIREKYFNEVLAIDFDFILNNMIKAITVSAKDTKSANSVVSGFKSEDGEVIHDKILNTKQISQLFSKTEGNKLVLKETTSRGAAIPNVIIKADLDTLSFKADTSLDNNSFYFTTIDEKYYYRDSLGNNTDITPVSFYSYNSASKRNQNSFDPFVGALDSDSSFIHNIFPMFRKVVSDENNKSVFGERMNVIDFLTLAPHLTNAGRTLEEFTEALAELASKGSEVGKIANTLLTHVFSPVATQMGNGESIYSIYQATQKNAFTRTSINHQIVKALHNALINKDNVMYMKVEEGKTSITKGLDTGSPSATVNTEFAGLLMKDSYTKRDIADRIPVSKGIVSVMLATSKTPVALENITTIPEATAVAVSLGIERTFSDIHKKYLSVMPVSKANESAINVLKNMVYIAAVNKKTDALKPQAAEERKIFEHESYITMSPSTVISGEDLNILGSLYNVDSHKSISVGGKLTASTSTPNRDSSLSSQIKQYNDFNNRVNTVKFTFNPFLDAASDKIFAASYDGTVLKTPTVVGGKSIKLASWDVKVRVEHAMIQGFLQGPKNIGREFYIQPINYSDKSNIPMHKIKLKENLLDPSLETHEALIDAYIEYQALKNEEMQRISLHHLKEFVVGNYEMLINSSKGFEDSNSRIKALASLRIELLKDYSEKQGNLTKDVNLLLSAAKIHPDTIKYSNSELDAGADFVTFEGNPGAAILKPHLGIRAELYRDPVKARVEVQNALTRNRADMESIKINTSKLAEEIKNASGSPNAPSIVSSVESLYDRFYLIHGIYGHALKTITMGDESYFSARYKKQESIEQYYTSVDNGDRTGLEESEQMMVAQFKRAQSELTRGNAYSQRNTIVGMKRRHKKDNILHFLNIFGDHSVQEYNGVKSLPKSVFEFEELKGKSLIELEGLGVISRFDNGKLVSKNALGPVVKFNVGKEQIILGTYMDSILEIKEQGIDAQLVDGMAKLLKEAIEVTRLAPSEIDENTVSDTFSTEFSDVVHGVIYDFKGREHALTLDTYLSEIEKINKNNFIVLPDLTPSMVISDPVSYINLLNSMGNTQENSDAIQFMHPLMSLMMEEARGGILGAFNTENQEALKLLSTTFEYDKMRQVLQKKSIQMPFTTEQMRKLGSVELYNTFKKMNTAIKFNQPEMTYVKTIGNRQSAPITVVAKDMDALYYTVMKNLSSSKTAAGHEVDDSVVWGEVMEILRQNPINMYNFVGLITVPSNQKTGHKKLNKYDSVFSKTENNDKPNIDYMANEYSYEVLTKAHSYDITGEMHEASSLTLLSQLVNAASFGGLSNLTTKNLQNAIGGRMAINSLRIGKDLAKIAVGFREDDRNPDRFNKIIDRLTEGNVSTTGLDSSEKDAFDTVLRAGVYEMANMAFEKNASMLIQKIIKGEKITEDADGNPITESGIYSMDSPAVRAKVMGTLRSAFFEDTVKMKMSGFIGTVSATHKTINIFSLPNGKRVGRSAFITGALQQNFTEGFEGQKVVITAANILSIRQQILPFDDVLITVKNPNGSIASESIRRFGSVTDDEIFASNITVTGILTPDMIYSDELDAAKLEALDDNMLVKITDGSGKQSVHYKWYLNELYSAEEIVSMVSEGKIKEDITEKYSLRWYQYTKDNGKYDLRSSDAYRQMYRASINKKTTEEEMNAMRALLILETQTKDENGDNVYSASRPEVVLPTYMAKAFSLTKGLSIADVIGTDGNDKINAAKYFGEKVPSIGARFIKLTTAQPNYTEQVIRIYSRKLVLESNSFDQEVLTYLEGFEKGEIISSAGIAAINAIISKAKVSHVNGMAEDFIASLEVALTRIPGQSKQSGFMGDVVEFLDAQGNATFAPTEHLVNTGGDMDIDTLSVLTKTIDSSGRMHPFSHFIDPVKGFSIKNMVTSYKSDLVTAEANMRDLIKKSNVRSEEYILNRQAKLALQTDPEQIKTRTRQLTNANKLPFTKEKEEILVSQALKKVHARYENMLANAVADGVFRSLDNVDTAVEANTPISMGMFDAIIKRIEDHKDSIKAVNITVAVERSKSFKELNILPVYSEEGVNIMNTSAKKKDFQHFGSPFTATGTPGMIHVGKHLMSRAEIMLPENADKLKENTEIAVEMYKNWLSSGDSYNPFEEISGYSLDLGQVAQQQKAWIKKQISEGSLDGKTLFDMSENGKGYTYANALADLVGTRKAGIRSGENYLSIFEYENLAAQGKEAIGIFATVIKINSAVQAAKINYDTNYASSDRISYDNPFFFKSSIEYTDFITNRTEEYSRSGFADLDRFTISESISKSTDLQKTIASLVNKDKKYSKDSVNTLVNILVSEMKSHLDMSQFEPTSKESLDLMESLSKSLFNIAVPVEVINSREPINAYKEFLDGDSKMVAKAYIGVIGKQLSNDAQSQFLSAATDNAKELILGKIRSNPMTNPIMTTMMLLGYDTKMVIDFLYDPEISYVLDVFAEKIGNLETPSITKSSMKAANIDVTTPAIVSLLDLIAVGEEISKFRAVRSLGETTQIEQHKLDRILEDMDSDILYKAIKEDKIDLIKPKSKAQNVFNPNMMIFLHPQSRYLFVSLYESEKFKMRSLFKTVEEVFAIAGEDSRSVESYKNISSYLSKFQVESFLNQSTMEKDAEGKESPVFRTGIAINKTGEGEYTKEILALNLPTNRAAFVKKFEDFVDYAKDELERIQGAENAALSNLNRGTVYGSPNPVFFFPKLKNTNIDSLEISLIHEGISELKIRTGNRELDELQKEIYNNFSLYALVVSSGEVKKGSMIEAFEEINLSLAAHINTLTEADYERIRPTTEAVASLIKGELDFEDVVITKTKKRIEDSKTDEQRELEEQARDAAREYGQEQEDDDNSDRELEEGEFRDPSRDFRALKLSKEVTKVHKGKIETLNQVYKVQDPYLRNDVFYSFREGDYPYRLFSPENNEALPNTSLPSGIDFKKIPEKIIRGFSLKGIQVGFTAVYDGAPIRILAYIGRENEAEMYLISHPSGTHTLAGVHLMEDNPDILLMGNVIQKINSRNLKDSIKKKALNVNLIGRVPKIMTPVDTSINVAIGDLFSDKELHSDFIISRESRVINVNAHYTILLKNSADAARTPSYSKYHQSAAVLKATKGSTSTLVPSIYTGFKNGEATENKVVSEMMSQVAGMLNYMDVGAKIKLYGIATSVNKGKNTLNEIFGGLDMVDDFLKPYKITRKDKTESILSGSFEIERFFDEKSNMTAIVIKRVKNNGGLVMVNGTITHVKTVTDKASDVISSETWLSDQVKLKALEENIITAPYKIVNASIDGKSVVSMIMLRTSESEDGYELFVKEPAEGYNDKYIKIHSTSDKDGIFDTTRDNFYMSEAKYQALLNGAKKNQNKFINPSC